MQPIGNIWNKFPRVVRDLAMQCGKQIRLEMEGKDTELDKTLIEAIKDPLTHIIRNSVDHGIETPEVRKSRGKPAEGTLFLRAYHEGGQVNIEISDDGGGIDTEKVKEKAIQKGLVSREQVGQMSERDIVNLVCLPGFSTADRVTNVSGRGVGMDVVRTNIEKIGGAVDIQSRPGQGTTIKIKIPLTLAIIPALVVTNNGERFAIPQVSLLELVRLEGEQARKGIEMIHGAPVYRLRGNLLPLVILTNELTSPEGTKRDLTSYTEDDAINIVVLQADGRQFGLIVDEINDTEEIVVKPLGKQLKGISAFAGATIMGDGRVALILDVLGLAQKSGVVSELRDGTISDKLVQKQDAATSKQSLLLFGVGESRRMALPLSEVTRLEEFPRSAVETAGNQLVVQYRGHIMPLIRVSEYVGVEGSSASMEDEALPVIVHTSKGQTVGLVVKSIIDIVDEAVTIERWAAGSGILGSAVIQGRVTDVVDVEGIVQAANPMTEELALAA
jgi:two-component system chemotaxis sensor kinase CheA